VKTWVKTRLKSEILTFFTARNPSVSWPSSPGAALHGLVGNENLTCNTDYPMANTFRWRIIHGKKGHTSLVGLRQLATWEEGNLKEATAEDDSELDPGRLRATADDFG